MITSVLINKPTRTRVTAPRGFFKKHRPEDKDSDGGVAVAPTAEGPPTGVDRENNIIRGYAVITRGEAIGHREWVDGVALQQVVRLGNEKPMGIKARYTHPGLSADGFGRQLGMAKNFRMSGDRVLADLHILDVAFKTPEGDLATYVMDFTEEAPEQFGTSIVFSRDLGAEDRFRGENSDEEGIFTSPDPENEKNFNHMRVFALHASDVVDEPAANPAGMLASFAYGSEVPTRFEALMSYSLGLSEEAPDAALLGMDPDRAKTFINGFLKRNQLEVVTVTGTDQLPEAIHMSVNPETAALATPATPVTPAAAAPVEEVFSADELKAAADKAAAEALAAEKKRTQNILAKADEFGMRDRGLALLEEGKTVEEALSILKDEKILNLQAGAPASAGADASQETSLSNFPEGEEKWKAEWDKSPQLQAEFTSKEEMLAFKKAEKEGRVTIIDSSARS